MTLPLLPLNNLVVRGVSVDSMDERCVHIYFNRQVTDDELRTLHEFLDGYYSERQLNMSEDING